MEMFSNCGSERGSVGTHPARGRGGLARYIHGNKELSWKTLQRLAGQYLPLREQ
jgi:hypothetical protein